MQGLFGHFDPTGGCTRRTTQAMTLVIMLNEHEHVDIYCPSDGPNGFVTHKRIVPHSDHLPDTDRRSERFVPLTESTNAFGANNRHVRPRDARYVIVNTISWAALQLPLSRSLSPSRRMRRTRLSW